MANRDDVLRKLQRQEPPPTTPAASPVSQADGGKRGHQPAPGTKKVSLNLRTAVWGPDEWDGSEGTMGVKQHAETAGVPPVTVIEALILRYLNDDKLRARINVEALRVVRDRRQLATQLRRLERPPGQ